MDIQILQNYDSLDLNKQGGGIDIYTQTNKQQRPKTTDKILFQKHGTIYVLCKSKPGILGKELIVFMFNNKINNNTNNTSTSTSHIRRTGHQIRSKLYTSRRILTVAEGWTCWEEKAKDYKAQSVGEVGGRGKIMEKMTIKEMEQKNKKRRKRGKKNKLKIIISNRTSHYMKHTMRSKILFPLW